MQPSQFRRWFTRSDLVDGGVLGGGAGAQASAGVDEAVLVGEHHGLGAVTQVELGEHAADVALHRRLGHDQARGDLRVRQSFGLGGAYDDHVLPGPFEVPDRAFVDQPAPVDHDHVVDGPGRLAQHVAGQRDRAAVRGPVPQQCAQPADALRVQAVHRLVQHEDLRIAQERRGEPEALPHAHRVRPDPAPGRLFRADEFQDLADPAAGQCGQRPQVGPAGPAGVGPARLDVHAEQAGVGPERRDRRAPQERPARCRPGQSDDRLERRGLARPVRAEEPRHPSGSDRERQVVNGCSAAVALGQSFGPDRRRVPGGCSWGGHAGSFRWGDLPVIRPGSGPGLRPQGETTTERRLPAARVVSE